MEGVDFPSMVERAGKNKKYFCIVLQKDSCIACDIYMSKLLTQDKAIFLSADFYNVNISLKENSWYEELFCPIGVPYTLIFSPNGNFLTSVPGAADTCVKCIRDILDSNNLICSAGLNSDSNYLNKARGMNFTLEAKLLIDRDKDATVELDSSFYYLRYPYNYYLKTLLEKQKGNIEESQYYARMLLAFKDRQYLIKHRNIRYEMKKMIDTTYNSESEPIIKLKSNNIILGEIKQGTSRNFSIDIKNVGKDTLVIESLILSCDCITVDENYPKKIPAKDSIKVNLRFTPMYGYDGELQQNIVIISNARNFKEVININAITKKN